jgi:CRP/FNR family transcriptional regulator, polysaccharide utilization system transcription regulator
MEQFNAGCNECFFKTTLCKGLSHEEFDSMFKLSKQITYNKGEMILKQGVKSNHLVFLTKGLVKFVYNNNGRDLIVTIDKSQTLLGLANILNEDINIFSIIAIEECEGCMIDIKIFKMNLLNNRNFMLEIMSISTQMFRKSIFNFISLAHKQVNGRIADILIYLSKTIYDSDHFQIALSRQEIAEFAGCSKENVIHTLRKFDADGIIKVSAKNIKIVNFDMLHKISRSG